MNSGKLSAIALLFIAFLFSCEKDDKTTLGGDISPMSQAGVTVGSSSYVISGVSNFEAEVASLESGVSVYSGSATVDNTVIKALMSNIPELTINGNTITGSGVKFRQTVEGIECLSGPGAGIWVKYDSGVGDTYPIGSTGSKRTVVSKSVDDDYAYGFMNIKTIQVEESSNALNTIGISKITYIANHRFGLVGIKFDFNDGSSAKFPIYTSAENE